MAQSSKKSLPAVSFLGPVSSYTHQATLQCFGKGTFEYQPATTIADVFEAVQSGEAEKGVVPFENSTNGAVIPTLELLADRNSLYPDLYVSAEAYLDVRHFLLGHKAPPVSLTSSPVLSGISTPTPSYPAPLQPKSKPLLSLKHIKRLHTHPQAYGQCEIFLGAYLKGVERREESSTSRSAEVVKADTSGKSAAIASSLAAEVHGLDILAENIEDREDNTTRFFILQKGKPVNDLPQDADVQSKSLVSFTVDHGTPGALADVLECFRNNRLNLTSINSRPTTTTRFQYIFFVEFVGSRIRDWDGRVEEALSCLDKHTQSWRWLGSWEDKLQR
ncbi:Prephenate dehydratase-domain-containing protein [Calycina marina]|uniref:prephenate dehydratase n=1 Tax=Calycina marina TaxID=1763456 RepID=A0A9P7Z863_9HELO|nr:Prephenate dehydratase-domain-containing protein [Calycina marina]